MTAKKNAPPKKGQNGAGRSTLNSNDEKQAKQTEKMPSDLKRLAGEIINMGGVDAVIEKLRANQTRTGPNTEIKGDPTIIKESPKGIIQKEFLGIEASLAAQCDKLHKLKRMLSDLGYWDTEPSEEKDKPRLLSDVASVSGKVNTINAQLMQHNNLLTNIIEHVEYLFNT